MPWVRIHDGALRNLKIAALSDAAFRLWVAGLAHAQEHLTDGEIRREHLSLLAAKPSRKVLAELTTAPAANRAPLWDVTTDGYQIHDFATWNDTRDEVLRKRTAKRDRIAAWRAKRDVSVAILQTELQDALVDVLQTTPQDALGNQAPTSTSTSTSTPLKNLGGEGPPPRPPIPIHGRRHPDLMTLGPVKLWASQFRDEIVALVATHHDGNRDVAYAPALAWVHEVDDGTQARAPSREAVLHPAKWWSAQAAARWGVDGQALEVAASAERTVAILRARGVV